MYKFYVLVLPMYLSACGGSTDTPDGNGTRPPIPYADYEAQAQELHDTWDAISFTDPSSLPMNGSANYSGVTRLDLQKGPDEISLSGDLQMTVSFANDTLTGNASDFVDENDAGYSGALVLSNGLIDRTADPAVDYTLRGDLSGSLGGGGENFDISADLLGDFHGLAWAAASGGVQGSAVSSFGTGYVFGDFIAGQ